ncbi:hypothetical protein [Vagococcus fluvialis]|uniref:hypothetical protein n=1 Tax=Vagococcus fluvialis TaxID=2738 RepID=UPI00378CEF65
MINISATAFIFTLFIEFFTFLFSFYYFIEQQNKFRIFLSFITGLPLSIFISIYFGVLSYIFLFFILYTINRNKSKEIFIIFFLLSLLIICVQGLLYTPIQAYAIRNNLVNDKKVILFLYSTSFILTTALIAPLLKKAYKNYIHSLTQYSQKKGKHYFHLLAVLLFLMLLTTSLLQYSSKQNIDNMIFIAVFFVIIFIFIIGIINISIKRVKYKIKKEKEKAELKQLILYTNKLEYNQQQLRKFKHDYLNILLSLQNSIQNENMDQIKIIFHEINIYSKDILNKYDTNTSDLANIKNLSIKSIFVSKFLSWEESILNNITFECLNLINEFYIDNIILVRILGNLLDNAYEEIKNQKIENRFIQIAVIDTDDSIEIVINNSTEKEIPHLSVLTKPKYSTKNNHLGLGLNNIQNLITSQQNIHQVIKIDNEKNIYSATILIEKKLNSM